MCSSLAWFWCPSLWPFNQILVCFFFIIIASFLDFGTQVPAPLLWEQELLKTSVEYQLTAATAQLFDERPIWAKATINDRLTDLGVVLTDNHVRRSSFLTS